MKTRKRKLLLALALTVFTAILLFTECQLSEEEEPITIQGRLDKFRVDLNNDGGRTRIYLNLHPDIRAAYRDPSTWEGTLSWANRNFEFNNVSYSANEGATVGTVEGQFVSQFSDDPFHIEMRKDDAHFYIYQMTLDPEGSPTDLFP